MEYRFAAPLWFFLFAALPVLAMWQIFIARRFRGTLRYSDLSLMEGLAAAPAKIWIFIPQVLRYLALALLIVAMARPQAGNVKRDVLTEGVDIMMVLDISGSMEANDFRPNRLEAAKQVIAKFIEGRESDRIGLVAFAAHSFTVCPLTVDYHALNDLLDRVHLGIIDQTDTAIGTGLVNGIHRLRDSEAASKVIVLLTDGVSEHEVITPQMAAEIAAGLGIKIYTIGMGRAGAFNPQVLNQIANMTGGLYFHAENRQALDSIYEQIDQMEQTEVEYNIYAQWDEMMMWFVWPALLLLGLEFFLRQTRAMQLP